MGRPVTPHVAGIVIGYWRNGRNYRDIAREVGVHRNTVYGIIKRFCERGNLDNRKSTGRPRKTNARDDRVLYRLVRENRRSSAQKLRRDWLRNLNVVLSHRTVNRRLQSRGYKARRMVKVPKLTIRAKVVRREWAQRHINRPIGHWRHVIFCDESRFMLFRIDNRIRVCRLVGEAMHEDCLQENVAYGGGSVHVWGGICHLGKATLRVLDRNVTGLFYRQILEEDLVPHAGPWYANNWILADDNARPHRAIVVEDYLQQQGITRLDWAPYSPDMNPIEHMWDEIGRNLEDLYPSHRIYDNWGLQS